MTTALVMVASSLGGALPLFLTQHAAAAGSTITVCDVACDANTLQAAIDTAGAGDTISFAGDASLAHELTISKELTLLGNGHTLSPTFTKTDNDNNASLGVIGATGPVAISSLTIDGTAGTSLHGINTFKSVVTLDGVTLKNNDRNGLVVNSANVTVNNITTSGNDWGGIDVDQNSTSSGNPAVLTVNGTSAHAETGADILIDNITHLATVYDTNAQYDIASIGNTRLYTLKTPVVTACSTTSTLNSSTFAGWDLSETRTTGHNELTSSGLHVWTEGATSTDKAAGYHPASFNLANLGEGFGLDATATTGTTPPSLQLTVDLDGNGTPEGNLVAEPAAYGADTLWLSSNWTGIDLSSAPTTINGGGTGKGGTVNAWLSAFPNAKVVAVGYSLGSGVHGDYVITKLTAGCTDYTFNRPANTAPTVNFVSPTPAENGYVHGAISAHVTATDDYGMGSYYVRVWKNAFESGSANLVYNGCSSAPGGANLGTSQDVTCNIDTNGWSDGKYVLSAQFQDSDITWGQALRTINVDNTAPTITVKSGYVGNLASKTFSNVSFKLHDANKVDKYVINGYTSDFTNNNDSDANFQNIKSHLVQGSNTLKLYDVAGNSTSYTFTYDSTVPTVEITSPSNEFVKGNTVTIKGSATDNDFNYYYCYVTLPGSSEVGVRGTDCNTTWHSVTNGTLGTVNITGLDDGHYEAHLVAYDKAGNHSDINYAVPFTLDNTRPSLSFTAPSDFSTPFQTGPTASVHGSDANGLTVLNIHVYNSANVLQSTACSATTAQLVSGDLSCDLSGLPEGTYYIKAGENDAAGNNRTITSPTFTIDRTAPTVTVTTQSTSNATPTLTGTVNGSNTGVTVTVNGHTYTATVSGTTWTVNVTDALAVGTYDVIATATDTAGNVGTDGTTNELTITAAPVAPAGTTPVITFTNFSQQFATTGNATTGGNTTTGTVLGTSTPSGKVKGASTTTPDTVNVENAAAKKDGNFLFLGWWWLAVLAVLGAFWLIAAKRRSDEQ